MIKTLKLLMALLLTGLIFFLSSCETEDPGPIQETTRSYTLFDFDRLEMGSAFNIRVEQANTFGIHVRGDRRNLDDLEVFKRGNTLVIQYDEQRNRRYETSITITMPTLYGVNFSGASVSVVTGFESDGVLDMVLSGASGCQLDAGYRVLHVNMSGASNLMLRGLGDELHANLSGASMITSFDFPVRTAQVVLSGASQGKFMVSDQLHGSASGGSMLLYRGKPGVDVSVSGGSRVVADE